MNPNTTASDGPGTHSKMERIRRAVLGRRGRTILIPILAFVLGMFILWAFSTNTSQTPAQASTPGHSHESSQAASQVQYYTCSMHPQVRMTDPKAKCPICGMSLIPVESNDATQELTSTFSPSAEALLHVEVSPVLREFPTHTVRMVGKVVYDETRLKYISAWAPGRLDRLFVDYEGMPIKKGDHMVEMYSPDLISAQEEYLQARKMVRELKKDDSSLIRTSAQTTLDAATDKLRLLGLTQKQIEELDKTGVAADHITIYAPTGGVVTQRLAKEGQYVKTGDRIYAIADLSQVWIQLEAYETDLPWLHYGQTVNFTTQAYPSQSFQGRISFISPVMNEKTRTVAVRVNAANPDELLKPGMFVQADVSSTLNAEGKVIAPSLAGKWICPMHPEVIQNKEGLCNVCGMDLVPAESLGYTKVAGDTKNAPLMIPASAVLQTGKRAVVYVEDPDAKQPTYTMQQITLGPRAGDRYVVAAGLKENQQVVTRGAFRIDSERQLRGLPSMMSPPSEIPTTPEAMPMPMDEKTPPAMPMTASAPAKRLPIVNSRCPMMDNPIDPNNVPDSLYREYKGQGVGFCCGGCPAAWDKLSDEEKDKKLQAVIDTHKEGQ